MRFVLIIKMVLTREIKEEIKSSVKAAVIAAFDDPDVLTKLVSAVTRCFQEQIKQIESKFTGIVNDLYKDNQSLKTEVKTIKEDNNELKNTIMQLKSKFEQDKKKNNLIINGISESDNEDVSNLVNEFIEHKLKTTVYPVRKCYRLGKPMKGSTKEEGKVNAKPRPILVQFENSEGKHLTWIRRKLLKNSGLSIMEDLSQYVLEMVKSCKAKYGKTNVWTVGGNVRVKYQNKIYRINKEQDFP